MSRVSRRLDRIGKGEERRFGFMSLNQSRAEKNEPHSRKPGRAGNPSHQRSFASSSGGKGGGATAPPFPSSSTPSLSTNRRCTARADWRFGYEGFENDQRFLFIAALGNLAMGKAGSLGQGQRAGTLIRAFLILLCALYRTVPMFNPTRRKIFKGGFESNVIAEFVGILCFHSPVFAANKPVDPTAPKGFRAIPKAPSSQSATGAADSTVLATPSKGDIPISLQFGSISPGFMNGIQVPARTSSAPPNIDEQKRDQCHDLNLLTLVELGFAVKQAHHDSFLSAPTLQIPFVPKQPQPTKDVSSTKPSSTAEVHLPTAPRRDAHVQSPVPSAATSAPKSSVLPVSRVSMPMPFQQQQIPLQFGAPGPQIQSQGMAATSLQIPLPMGNASQVQQQVFVPGLQSHQLQPQAMMHQGQNMAFAHPLSHQLAPQLSNVGVGMAPPFGQPQAGKFGGPRRPVKITHPETHEELKLDDRTETYTEAGSSGPRSHSSIPPQSQPIPSFSAAHSVNFYPSLQPNSYNPPVFFSGATSLPLTSNQMTPGTQASRYSFPAGQGGQTMSFINTSGLNSLPSSKAGPQMHGVSEPLNVEHARNGVPLPSSAQSTSVRVTVKPATEKAGTTAVLVNSHGESKIDLPKLGPRQPSEASATHLQRSGETGPESFIQQPKPTAESSDAGPLHMTSKHSAVTSSTVSSHSLSSSASPSVPCTQTEDSASLNTEGKRRETVRRSDSFKDPQKRAGKKEQRQTPQHHQADVSDSTGISKAASVRMSKDSSSSDVNASQLPKNNDIAHAPSEMLGASSASRSLASPSVEQSVSSFGGLSETEEDKLFPLTSEACEDKVMVPTMAVVPQDACAAHHGSLESGTDGVEADKGGHTELLKSSNPEVDITASDNLASDQIKQSNCSPAEIEPEQETTEKLLHTGPSVSESSKGGGQLEVMSENVLEANIVNEPSCVKTAMKDTNMETLDSSSDVESTVANAVASGTSSTGLVDVETTRFVSSSDVHRDKSLTDPSEMKSEKSIANQGLSHQQSGPVLSSLPSGMATKLEGRGAETTSSSQVSTFLLGSKDRNLSLEQNRTKSTGKKKKRKEFLSRADAAGTTSDLYGAYKGPEEKQEILLTSESADSSSGDMKQESAGVAEKPVVAAEDDGQSKSELDDWEDAIDMSTPKLEASENGEVVHNAKKHSDVYGSEASGRKKYSRDFLLTFSAQCPDLPEGFQIGSDLADVVMGRPIPISYIVDRELYPNSGRIVDRPTGGSRLDRRGAGGFDGDKWSRSPGSYAAGHDPRLDPGHGGMTASFRPGQGGNHGVLRNPRGQPSGPYGSGILTGPMQPLASPGSMLRNNADADRWQRASALQKGLIPSPQSHLQAMHKAEKKYEVGKVSDKEEAKQRQLKAILNKLTPQNFEKLFEQVKAVNIDTVETLKGVISQIFDKALMEPTFCEMYANFCFHLANTLRDFNEDNEKITFKRLLLNKCQEEFERGEREEAEANKAEEEGECKVSEGEIEEKKVKARRRMLGNIRLIGELYKKKMLTERIMHECIKKLLGQSHNPDEENIEALCKLMSTIGEMIDHPKAKEHIDSYFDDMLKLSNNQRLSSRVRFMLKDAIDLRKNRWQQRRKVEGPKKIEDVHRDAAQERQAQTSRLSRGSGFGSSGRRGQSIDYSQRGPSMLSSPSSQQAGSLRGLPSQGRGFGNQDVRMEDRHPLESRTLSFLPQRSDDDSITLGPQGGLARGMSIKGQPLMAGVPIVDVSSDPRRMASGPNAQSLASDWTPHNSREELAPRHVPDRFTGAPSYDQTSSLDRNVSFGNRDVRSADRSFDRSASSSLATGRIQPPLIAAAQNDPSESEVPEERLRDMSIAAIREFYSARNEEEVRLCIKDLRTPSFYPDMVMLWVTDSFERKSDVDRDLLAALLVNLCKSRERVLTQVHLVKGFESVLSTLEDAITDSPKAAEYLGRILGKVIYEDVLSSREIGRLINGGDEPGSLLQSRIASDVLLSIFDIIGKEKGDLILNEIRTSSNLRLEDFRPPDPIKSSELDAFM
ncbi:hypothetical protein ACLOJK_030408 [Asimina triloba]